MRRWNGWGDETVTYPLPDSAGRFLSAHVGAGTTPRDATMEEVLARVPPSRLPPHPLVSQCAGERLRHTRGQSLPDWIALRSGRIAAFPDGVAHPETEDQVRDLIRFARESGASLIPYGGGTSVLGHINAAAGGPPVLTVDLGRLSRLSQLDTTSHIATFGAGVCGPDLESQLRDHGYTLGHFPQSFELSTLGGWVATRSAGQQSLGYGRIEDLFLGGRLETPAGTVDMPVFPASAAGPDVREMVLGSEGRLGILTNVSVRVRRVPPCEVFHAVFFPGFEPALLAVRQIVQEGLPLCMLRLSTPIETETTLATAGHERLIRAMERYLSLRGAGGQKCMLIAGFTGAARLVRAVRKQALAIARRHRGIHIGHSFGRQWHKKRFQTPYLRNTLWEAGYAVDTLETATTWSNVPRLIKAIESALRDGLVDQRERVHVFTHLSHAYVTGSNIYTSYVFRLAPDPAETLHRWQRLKNAASRAIVDQGATISHQHGIGEDHLRYVSAEKGELAVAAIRGLCRTFDPQGIMNPGKLVPPDAATEQPRTTPADPDSPNPG